MPAPLARRLLLLLGVRACVCGRLVPVYRAACGRSQAALHAPERRYIGGASFDEVKAYYRELASVGLPVLDWAQQTVWGIQSARVSDRLLRSDLVRSDHQVPGVVRPSAVSSVGDGKNAPCLVTMVARV